MDADSNDFANGLSSVVTRDGQGAASTSLNVNGVGATAYTAAIDTASAVLVLNKAGSAHSSNVFGASRGLLRWNLALGNVTVEAGGNSGSDLAINRYSDAGTFIDAPISIARSTGIVTIANLNVLGGISAPISGTNVVASGSLSVGTTSTFTGVATFNAQYGAQMRVPAGQVAEYRCVVAGQRDWGVGEYSAGYFRIADYTAGAERMTINSSGQVSFFNTLFVSAGSDPIQCTAPSGSYARYSSTVTGARQWMFGCRADGTFSIEDIGGGIRFQIAQTGGAVTITGSLTCNGSFNTNAITGSTITALTNLQCSVTGNALLYLTSNGVRQWYIGAINNGQLYFTDVTANATRMIIDTGGTIYTQNGIIQFGTGHAIMNDGVNYANLGAHTIGFNNSGATLTFFALGGTTASWTFSVSDERLKQNIAAAEGDALAELRRLKLISYDLPYADAPSRHFECGFSAQDVRGIIPEAVVEANHAKTDEPANLVLSLDTFPLLARLVGAVQQMAKRIETLEARP